VPGEGRDRLDAADKPAGEARVVERSNTEAANA
jgi:hypothetical protein